jgi:hypothetical protein
MLASTARRNPGGFCVQGVGCWRGALAPLLLRFASVIDRLKEQIGDKASDRPACV